MSLKKQKEQGASAPPASPTLSRDAVIDTLSERIAKDIGDAMVHVDAHEIIGILEMIKVSVVSQVLASTAKHMSDAIIGDKVVN